MQTCPCSALGMLWHPGGRWWVPAPGKCNLPWPHPVRTRTLPRGLADAGRGRCQLHGDGSSERITQLNCLASCEHQQRILFLHLFSVVTHSAPELKIPWIKVQAADSSLPPLIKVGGSNPYGSAFRGLLPEKQPCHPCYF